jgi:zinc/manganese transport system substrate-binding protein
MATLRPISRPFGLASMAAVCALVLGACGDDVAQTSSTTAPDSADTADTDAAAVDAPAVLATTSIWADVTANVACNEIEVTTLIPVGTDAHSYEPSVQDADELRAAGLVVANGLGLEEGLLDSIEAAEADGVPVVELAEGLNPIEAGTGHSEEEKPAEEDGHSHSHEEEKPAEEDGHSHSHEGEDPHVWMDPDRVALAVPVIAEALASLDGLPVDAAQIDACAEDYVAELGALSGELDEQFAGLSAEQRRLVTSHEALGYLADRFDFEVIGAIIPSTSTLGESNVRDLEELASTMTDKGVTRIFGEVTGSDDVAAALAEQVGSQVEVVALYTESLGDEGSEAATYLGMMRANGSLIAG